MSDLFKAFITTLDRAVVKYIYLNIPLEVT